MTDNGCGAHGPYEGTACPKCVYPKPDAPERTPLSERTRAMPGELDQLVARLTEIHDYQSHGVHVSNDPGGMGTIICFGQDMELRSWYVKANGQLSDGAEVDARAIADLWNALPTIIDGLSRVVALEQERARFEGYWREKRNEVVRLRAAIREVMDRINPDSIHADILQSALDGDYRVTKPEGE